MKGGERVNWKAVTDTTKVALETIIERRKQ